VQFCIVRGSPTRVAVPLVVHVKASRFGLIYDVNCTDVHKIINQKGHLSTSVWPASFIVIDVYVFVYILLCVVSRPGESIRAAIANAPAVVITPDRAKMDNEVDYPCSIQVLIGVCEQNYK